MRNSENSNQIRGRSSCHGLRRAAKMALVAVCKVALLLAALEATAETLESSAEVSQCEQIDLANPPQGVGFARRESVKRLPTRFLRAQLSAADGSDRCGPVAHAVAADGHRLANRLCAPMRC